MASSLNKFMSFLKLTDEDDYDDDFYDDDYDDDDYDEKELQREERRVQREQRRADRKTSSYSRSDYARDRDYDDYDEPPTSFNTRKQSASKASAGKVVSIHPVSSASYELSISRPANFGESQQVCETLLSGQPVVVNLEGIDMTEAQRIIDLISGCIFAISGNMRQVSRYIFVFSPKNIDISGDYLNTITANDAGINFPKLNKEF